MSHFSPELPKATDEELMGMIQQLNPAYTVLASDELTRRALRKLEETITVSNEHSKKLEIANYRVQITMMVLTSIGTLVVVFPILKSIFVWLTAIPLIKINLISGALSVVVAFATLTGMKRLDDVQIRKLIKQYEKFLP